MEELFSKLEGCRKTGRILDVGCSIGFLLQHACLLGWSDLHGLEVSHFAAEYTRTHFHATVHEGILEDDTYPKGLLLQAQPAGDAAPV